MKKLLLIAVVALVGMSASAQVKYNRTFAAKKSNTMWYVRAGLNMNSLSLDDGDFESQNSSYETSGKTGFNLDFGFNKGFGKSNAYWGMELGVSSRGGKIEEFSGYKGYDDNGNEFMEWVKNGEYSFTGYNVKFVPLMFGYKYPVTEDIKIDGHIGGFVSYDFTTSEDEEDMYDVYSDSDVDAGLQVGVGVWYKRVNLDLMYQKGFIKSHTVSYYDEMTAKNSAIVIRLGVAF